MSAFADEHLIGYGPCWACGHLFTFHPDLVPSVWIDPVTQKPPDLGGDPARAERQQLCRTCIDRANERRAAAGEPLIEILPGAYLEGD